ncbi:L-threonylcarbamoyladenylate synthase [Aerosakkonemataceae cyanobacterium BLCC-F154]|uniref:L-threonylcarbamoyladenylate synthase n=1 Tax=Floridaenema fluviatile BLCC-F154 TaxID=3153640 RepID=A0ABV4Y5I0_9CYAN
MKVSIDALINGAKSGSVVSFPTDTVPALAVLPEKSHLIFEVKRRSQDKPLILMAATAEELWPFCRGNIREFPVWQEVSDRYWPGALTLVLPASDRVPGGVNPLDPTTIGIRVPNSSIARQILAQTGPLATTSANLSGQPPLESMLEIAAQFPDVLTLLWEEESKDKFSSVPSTVAKWMNHDWQILRQGAIKLR